MLGNLTVRTTRASRGVVACGAVVLSLVAAAPALAVQNEPERVKPPAFYAPELHNTLCGGNFHGSIIWSSGATFDCSTDMYQPARPPQGY